MKSIIQEQIEKQKAKLQEVEKRLTPQTGHTMRNILAVKIAMYRTFISSLESKLMEEREMVEHAYGAGFAYGHADGADISNLTTHPDKEAYLNQLYQTK